MNGHSPDMADYPDPARAPVLRAEEGEVLFDAVITPHRSLSRRGFGLLMLAIGGVSFTAGTAFILMGAWPVFGFMGLDVALVYIAFRLNYRSARAWEHVHLTRERLTIRRLDHRGRWSEVMLQPYWLRLDLKGGVMPERLTLATHGERHIVAAWLSPAERAAFAEELSCALEALRRPPQPSGPALSQAR